MARSAHKETVKSSTALRSLLREAGLSESEEYAVHARAGFATGKPQTLSDIGDGLESIIGHAASRQYAHMLLKDALEKLRMAGLYEAVVRRLPVLAAGRLDEVSITPSLRAIRRLRCNIKKLGQADVVSYVDLLSSAGINLPESRLKVAHLYDEQSSCVALFEDFGVRRFGNRIKICNHCGIPKPLDEYYRIGKTGNRHPYCKECNTSMCGERYRRKHKN